MNNSNKITICYLQINSKIIKRINLILTDKYATLTLSSIDDLIDFIKAKNEFLIIFLSDKDFIENVDKIYHCNQNNPMFICTDTKQAESTIETLKSNLYLTHEAKVITDNDLTGFANLLDNSIKTAMQNKEQLQFMHKKSICAQTVKTLNFAPYQQAPTLNFGVIILQKNGTVCYANSYAKRLLDMGSDFETASILNYFNVKQHLRLAHLIVDAVNKNTAAQTIVFNSKSKLSFIEMSSALCAVDDNDFVLLYLHDITDYIKQINQLKMRNFNQQKQIDAIPMQLQQIRDRCSEEKNVSLAYLSTGIAHSINNPLAGISIAITNINNRLMKNDEQNAKIALECGCTLEQVTKYMNKHKIVIMQKGILEQIQRISTIIKNTLIYSSTALERPMDYYNINVVIKNAIQMLKIERNINKEFLLNNINIIEQNSNIPTMIYCNPHEIGLVIFHLLKNAAESIWRKYNPPNNQSIHIRHYTNNNYCHIEVEDAGNGVLTADYQHIFEPFYSTDCKLAGLGLAICNSIVTYHHKGKIYPKGKLSKGAIFVVELPIKKPENST